MQINFVLNLLIILLEVFPYNGCKFASKRDFWNVYTHTHTHNNERDIL